MGHVLPDFYYFFYPSETVGSYLKDPKDLIFINISNKGNRSFSILYLKLVLVVI